MPTVLPLHRADCFFFIVHTVFYIYPLRSFMSYEEPFYYGKSYTPTTVYSFQFQGITAKEWKPPAEGSDLPYRLYETVWEVNTIYITDTCVTKANHHVI